MNDGVKIIENGVVVTCDSQDRVGNFVVLIKADRIAEISTRPEVLKALYPAAEVIDAQGKLLLPGFIDAHVHGESFVLRHFTALKPFSRWARETEVKKAFDFVYERAGHQELSAMYRLAYFTALKSGVTTIGEFGFDHQDQPLNASFETMRRADVRGVIGVHNGDQIERCRTHSHASVRYALAFPPEEDLTTYNLQSTLRAAARLKWPLFVHAGETKKRLEGLRKNFQKSLIEVLREHRFFDGKVVLLHCALLEPPDLDILENSRASVVLTPRSVILKETDVPGIAELVGRRIPIVLASDWGLSDPFDVLRSYVTLARGQNVEIPVGSNLVRMMTIEAARALGVDDLAGSLEVGKKADIAFVDIAGARFAGIQGREIKSFLSPILLESTSRDVTDVVINGEFFVRQGQLLTYSKEDLVREGEQVMDALTQFVSGSGKEDAENLRVLEHATSAERIERVVPGSADVARIPPQEPIRPVAGKKILSLQPDHKKKIELPAKVKKIFRDEET